MTTVMQARPTQGRRQGNRSWLFLPLALAFAIIAGIAIYGVLSPSKAKPAPAAPGFRGSLVWGDGIFSNKAQLKAWLRLHGASYKVWVKEHPAALSLVKPRPKPRPKPRRAAVAAKKTPPKAHHVAAAPPGTVTSHRVSLATPAVAASQRNQSSVRWLFILLGLLISTVAMLTPKRISARVGLTSADREREVRLAVAGVGFAVLAGAAAGLFL
jgi:hypothetical protein